MPKNTELGEKVMNYEGDMSLDQTMRELLTPMQKALMEAGITPKMLAEKIIEYLSAEDKKFFAHQGKVEDEKTVKAWDVQLKAQDIAHKLRGDYAPEKQDLTMHDGIPEYNSTEEEILKETSEKIAKQTIEAMRNKEE